MKKIILIALINLCFSFHLFSQDEFSKINIGIIGYKFGIMENLNDFRNSLGEFNSLENKLHPFKNSHGISLGGVYLRDKVYYDSHLEYTLGSTDNNLNGREDFSNYIKYSLSFLLIRNSIGINIFKNNFIISPGFSMDIAFVDVKKQVYESTSCSISGFQKTINYNFTESRRTSDNVSYINLYPSIFVK